MRIKVCPEGYTDGQGSDITLNRRDMRSKFGYATLYTIVSKGLKARDDIVKRKPMYAKIDCHAFLSRDVGYCGMWNIIPRQYHKRYRYNT